MDDAWVAWKQKVKEIAINEWKKEKRKRNSLRKKLMELRLSLAEVLRFNPNNEEARRMNDVAKEELEAKERATEKEEFWAKNGERDVSEHSSVWKENNQENNHCALLVKTVEESEAEVLNGLKTLCKDEETNEEAAETMRQGLPKLWDVARRYALRGSL